MNQSERSIVKINYEGIAGVIADSYNLNPTDSKVSLIMRKVGQNVGKDLFRDLLRPVFFCKMITCKELHEDMARGNLYLTLTDEMGLGEFSRQYEKALAIAEKESGKNRNIERVRSTLNIFAPIATHGHATATLRIAFVQAASSEPMSYVSEQFHEFNYEIELDHADNLIDNPQMPDIEERSIASPVYLVNSQQTKNTFGCTVKEDRLGIYLMARRYGWSEVSFHGQQVLLKADIMVR
ncbi:hypothetical protein pEaSNUABM9_00186 [Erwinia phage pEa_SNUABM_9]|nr:hypothetical protein pEaSNUABM9_00186 [Erwinia phage pEa_SNUABM_9]